MSFHANRRPQRTPWWERWWPVGLLGVAAAGGGTAAAVAPDAARGWVVGCVVVAWAVLALTLAVSVTVLRRRQALLTRSNDEIRGLHDQAQRQARAVGALGHTTLPAVAGMVRDGAGVGDVLATVAPQEEAHRQIIESYAAAVADHQLLRRQHAALSEELDAVNGRILPFAITSLAEGQAVARVINKMEKPADPRLHSLVDTAVRALGISERRAAAAQGASSKALGRVQAKTVSILADLRDMQDRYEGEIFGDLLQLDHKTSQLGMETDRIALLMGGRASRAWNRPIEMESILRGAIGRIAAYQRVRLHCATDAKIVGFAAEGLMHLLAELVDNATKFSPPIDIVPVYVEEASAGVVITIEDSGLKMADAAMVRAEESVSGRNNDLAVLHGTRLGLPVVGRLAAKYGVDVNFRPSSRGGTGVVVLIPTRLVSQEADQTPLLEGLPQSSPLAAAVGLPDPQGVPHTQAPQAPGAPQPPSLPQSPDVPQSPGLPHTRADEAPAPAAGHTPEPPAAPARSPQVPAPAQPPEGLPRRVRRTNAADAATSTSTDSSTPAPDTGTPPEPPAGRHAAPAPAASTWSTPNGLPVRPAGRTMAAAHTGQDEHPDAGSRPAARSAPRRDLGAQFGAFHRSRRTGKEAGAGHGSGDTAESPDGNAPEEAGGTHR
ncbi:IgA FC receptor precursor [Streptomyces sp. YIM 130001]|uniref:ATP-binding protein n=1 Tax=Streptomyces sp. YIM 130001 TaxID=2259644 RepID=UPI000E64E77A|nr:ATP-binding protein [Streptomyces sp. YIM 130001]RII09180.1 IgA FC receptor precursor [Streptomyces sp. YIM 130001]